MGTRIFPREDSARASTDGEKCVECPDLPAYGEVQPDDYSMNFAACAYQGMMDKIVEHKDSN